MSEITLVIVTYRDVFQWAAKHKGGSADDFQERSALVKLSPEDLQALGMAPGRAVKLKSRSGEVVVRAEADDGCPSGFAFMPVSPYASRLASYDAARYCFPDFKRIEARVESTADPISPL